MHFLRWSLRSHFRAKSAQGKLPLPAALRFQKEMALRILIGVSSAIVLGVTGYLLILAGSVLSSVYEAKILGGILAIPGYIIVAPGLLGVGLIDYLPMHLIFPKGGASGVFGSILIFAVLFWSIFLSFLSCKQYWPYKTLTRWCSRLRLGRAKSARP
ncbi:hypothetical protein [Microbulbifer sp. NBRC 101763]|uniref:hypothetical protein n=1 Tax=Microbulbifer sp. NBRC 101763 TaxID=1113820 RepID=UPI0033425662